MVTAPDDGAASSGTSHEGLRTSCLSVLPTIPGTPSLVDSRGHLPLMEKCLKKTWTFQPRQSINFLFITKSVWIVFLLLEIRALTENTAFSAPGRDED